MLTLDILSHISTLIQTALAGCDVFTGGCWLACGVAFAMLIFPKSSNF
jgi:hypothetical protein